MQFFKSIIFTIFLLLYASSFLYAIDPVSTNTVAPGVIHSQYLLSGPNTLDVLSVDLKNPYLQFESCRPAGLTRTTVQCAANDKEGHRVIGAVNADFFSFETGWPVNNQIVNGKPVLGISSSFSQIAVAGQRKIYLDGFSFSGKIISSKGIAAAINNANSSRPSGTMALFTSFKGASTGTDGTGTECSLQLLSPAWSANDTLLFIVTQKSAAGNMLIPLNGAVISGGSGTPSAYLSSNLSLNDTVKLFLGYAPNYPHITQLIAGRGRLLRAGVNLSAQSTSIEGLSASFTAVRHPRTFIGFNADTSKLFLCTVDGRLASSIGMTFLEMSNFLLAIGASDGFNLDGGGSTTMVVRGEVVNTPSDPGGERSVANSFQLVSIAPTGTLHDLNILEKKIDLFQGNSHQFRAEGKDEYYNPLALPSGVEWSCDLNIGSIDSTGLFRARNVNDSGYVRIRYNAISDSARVYVRVIRELRVYPQTLTMVPGERLTLSVKGIDSGKNKTMLENKMVSFLSSSPGLNVDADGVATATGFGNGTVTVKLDTVACIVPFSSMGSDTTVLLDDFHDTFNWTWDVQDTDPDNITFALSDTNLPPSVHSFKIGYSFPLPAATVILNTNIPISSRCDSMYIRVFSDGGGHGFTLIIRDKDGEFFSVRSLSKATWKNQWNTIGFKMVYAVPLGSGTIDYPVTITKIIDSLGTLNQINGRPTGQIFLDDLTVHYPNRTAAPSVLYDFNTDVSGWLQPSQGNVNQIIGIIIASSKLEKSAEHPYEGAGCGKWTFVDDPAKTNDWDIRITRGTTSELGSMLRGSYIGAWVWANGQTNLTLRTAIRDGNGQICQGPPFTVNHFGWKLIGTKLDDKLFTPYLTSGKITDVNNRFNGFRVEGPNSVLTGQTRFLFIDKMVTSALTVPSGFISYTALWDSAQNGAMLQWAVNSEISINRYILERSSNAADFSPIGSIDAAGNTDTTKQYSFFDAAPSRTAPLSYRIRQITNDGAMELSQVFSLSITGISVDRTSLPSRFELFQNYPNPFNPETTFRFSIPRSADVRLRIFDLLGREVSSLADRRFDAGFHTVAWDANRSASGIYFCRMEAENFSELKKIILLR